MIAVPITATDSSIPAWCRASTSVYPSTTTARPFRAIAERARSIPNSISLLRNTPSGELRYFGPFASSPSERAPNPITRPRGSRTGNAIRFRKRS